MIKELTKAEVQAMKDKYPSGSEVELVYMGEDHHPIAPGTRGTVTYVDCWGSVNVEWHEAEGDYPLSMIPGIDEIRLVKAPETSES